jgi:hypothetical protein
MTSLIHKAKGCYQFVKATVPETWAQYHYPYREEEAFELASKSIGDRLSYNTGRFNFIMVVPVVNWEITLLQHASIHGSCHHLNIEARGFFESKLEWEKYRADNSAKLKAFFDACYVDNDINILFLYISEFHINSDCLLAFKLKNVIIVHFNWDDRLHYTSKHKGQSVGVKRVAKAADFNLTMAVGPMSRYVSDTASVFYWRGINNFAAAETVLPQLEFNRVLFFGSRYGYRAELIEYLTRKNLPLDVFGSGWGTDFISYETLSYKIPRYALNLGVSTIGYTQGLSCVKGRDFEVPLSGGLYLTNQSLEIQQVYNSGKEILTYTSMDDCYRQASTVLENPQAYAHIRRSGALKAQAFSWTARFNYLVSLVQSFTTNQSKP